MRCMACQEEIAGGFKFCPGCGTEQASVSPSAEGPEPSSAAKSVATDKSVQGCLFFGAVGGSIFLLLMIMAMVGSGPKDPCSDEVGAFVMAQEFVERQLRSPSTADFAMISDEGSSSQPIEVEGRCAFLVRTYVDAQNAFGATVRQNFRVVVSPGEGDTWNLIAIE